MKHLVIALFAGLFAFSAQAEPDDSTTIYRTYTETLEEAQAVVNGINNNSIRACKFGGGYKTKQKAYRIEFVDGGAKPHINGKGQIVMKPSKYNTIVKVSCSYKDKD